MSEALGPNYRLILSTHPECLQASAMLLFAALAYPELTLKAEDHRLRYYEALVAYFAQAAVKNAVIGGARLADARKPVPRQLREVRHDRISRAFNMAGRRIDRRLAAAFILRGITTPEKWDLKPQRIKLPVRPVEREIARQFGTLDSIFDAHKASKARPGEELEKGQRGNIRKSIWQESLPVLHLAAQIDELLETRAEVLAPWQNKIIGLISRPDWLPAAVESAQFMAEHFLPLVLKPAERPRLLPLFLTPEPY